MVFSLAAILVVASTVGFDTPPMKIDDVRPDHVFTFVTKNKGDLNKATPIQYNYKVYQVNWDDWFRKKKTKEVLTGESPISNNP